MLDLKVLVIIKRRKIVATIEQPMENADVMAECVVPATLAPTMAIRAIELNSWLKARLAVKMWPKSDKLSIISWIYYCLEEEGGWHGYDFSGGFSGLLSDFWTHTVAMFTFADYFGKTSAKIQGQRGPQGP